MPRTQSEVLRLALAGVDGRRGFGPKLPGDVREVVRVDDSIPRSPPDRKEECEVDLALDNRVASRTAIFRPKEHAAAERGDKGVAGRRARGRRGAILAEAWHIGKGEAVM